MSPEIEGHESSQYLLFKEEKANLLELWAQYLLFKGENQSFSLLLFFFFDDRTLTVATLRVRIG